MLAAHVAAADPAPPAPARMSLAPAIVVDALVGGQLGEGGDRLTGFLSIESGIANPIWLHVRVGAASRYQKLDTLVGYTINVSHTDPDSMAPTVLDAPRVVPSSAIRQYLVIAAGLRTVASFDSVQPGDAAKSTAYFPTALAGIQLHQDTSRGAHKSFELYGAFRTVGAGFVAAAHASFDAVPWLSIGAEAAYVKLDNRNNDLYGTLEIGVSWGN